VVEEVVPLFEGFGAPIELTEESLAPAEGRGPFESDEFE
jgi:hypothetical protein